ncbi:hypothetical protein ACFLT2_03325 [Acidobacteriota bacterium]
MGGGSKDFLVIKLYSNGVIQWQKKIVEDSDDEAQSILQTTDGGYIIVGTKSFRGDYWVIKLNNSGDIQWQKVYDTWRTELGYAIQQTDDSGYIVAGTLKLPNNEGADDINIIKLDSNGDIEWQKTYGGGSDEFPWSIKQTDDGGYIVAGETQSFGAGNKDILLIKLDSNGLILWQKTYGGASYEHARYIQETIEGGYIVVGQTASFGSGGEDAFILKLDSNGNIPDCPIIGTSYVTAYDSSVTVIDTTATAIDTNITPWSTSPSVADSTATITEVCYAIPIEIDIQPGNDFNHVNPKSNGVIQVAILTTQDFDAGSVDTATLLFGRTGCEASPKRIVFKDVDKDGDIDMLLQFKTRDTGIQCGDTVAYLSGMTIGGQSFQCSDSIETVGCK